MAYYDRDDLVTGVCQEVADLYAKYKERQDQLTEFDRVAFEDTYFHFNQAYRAYEKVRNEKSER